VGTEGRDGGHRAARAEQAVRVGVSRYPGAAAGHAGHLLRPRLGSLPARITPASSLPARCLSCSARCIRCSVHKRLQRNTGQPLKLERWLIMRADTKVQEAAREGLSMAAVQEVLTEWSRERGRGEGGDGASHKCRVAVEVLCREGNARLALTPFVFFFLARFASTSPGPLPCSWRRRPCLPLVCTSFRVLSQPYQDLLAYLHQPLSPNHASARRLREGSVQPAQDGPHCGSPSHPTPPQPRARPPAGLSPYPPPRLQKLNLSETEQY
jgi:hypothetical protein